MAKKDAKGKEFGRNNFVNNQQTESYRQQLKVYKKNKLIQKEA